MKTLKPHPSEHQIQAAIFDWSAAEINHYPELKMMFAIPNGGARHLLTGARLKREGVKPGVPDIFLAVPRRQCHGLFIELKSFTGQLSEDQGEWIGRLSAQGYRTAIIRSIDDAIKLITEYLEMPMDGQPTLKPWWMDRRHPDSETIATAERLS